MDFFENKNQYIFPKIIYGYWDNLDTNPVIQSHINTWKRNISKDWKIIILNKNNVSKYVSSDFMNKYNKLDPTRFADFLRVDLLSNNGGVWLDASIIITNGKFLDTYYNEMVKYKYDACLYELKVRTIDKNIPYLENWFIMSPKNSKLITDLYVQFDKAYKMGFLNYKKQILIPSNMILDKTIGYGDRTYLMQHAIINYLIHIGNKYNINIKNASESMFKIHINNEWKDDKIIKFILDNDDWNNYYALKLVKSNRRSIHNIDEYISKINSF